MSYFPPLKHRQWTESV